MIPKNLNEIEWSDIEGLIAIGREEDDTIEFKSSFKGGSDFTALTDGQRDQAVEAIAKEAIAFLNGRGGDIIVGLEESSNDHPMAKSIMPLHKVTVTADRLAQSLAARIEPFQTVLSVKAIRPAEGRNDGVIVVRAPSSLRAPHRSSKNRECYVRRGRESLPMPMDEIQDLVLNRSARRSERFALLDNQFSEFGLGKVRQRAFSSQRFHIRSVFIPFVEGQIEIDSSIQTLVNGNGPLTYRAGNEDSNDVVFRRLGSNWKPILRGRAVECMDESRGDEGNFIFCSKSIKTNLVISTDFVARTLLEKQNGDIACVHFNWIVGYLANSLGSFRDVLERNPSFASGLVRIAVCSSSMNLRIGDNMWASDFALPNEVIQFPDFEVIDLHSFEEIFQQAQVDVCSLVGMDHAEPYSFSPS